MQIGTADSDRKRAGLRESKDATDQEIKHIRANVEKHLEKENEKCKALQQKFDKLEAQVANGSAART